MSRKTGASVTMHARCKILEAQPPSQSSIRASSAILGLRRGCRADRAPPRAVAVFSLALLALALLLGGCDAPAPARGTDVPNVEDTSSDAVLDAAAVDTPAFDTPSVDTPAFDVSADDVSSRDVPSRDVSARDVPLLNDDVPCDATCGGRCVDLATDRDNCGACGRVCVGAVCVEGACRCAPGFADCDSNPANGCEADLSQPSSCGACANVCPAPANTYATCGAGTCGTSCQPGFGDCDSDPTVRCETDLRTIAHCGACGSVCVPPPNMVATCEFTACRYACAGGFGDCDGIPTNGCESDLRAADSIHCGRCFNPCVGGASCVLGACACAPCPAGAPTACGERCVNTATDANHCGACGHACGAGVCVAGVCRCAAGATLCGAACVNTAIDSENCGACGVVCEGGRACVGGVCSRTACRDGWIECEGRCVDPMHDYLNCGRCGALCAPGYCQEGFCFRGDCPPPGFIACAGRCPNAYDPATCGGGCPTRACSPGQFCNGRACVCPH